MLPFAGTSQTAMMMFFFTLSEPSRDPWHAARLRAILEPRPPA